MSEVIQSMPTSGDRRELQALADELVERARAQGVKTEPNWADAAGMRSPAHCHHAPQPAEILPPAQPRADSGEIAEGQEAAGAAGDTDLESGLKIGSAPAFGELYVRHARAVYRFCGRRTGDWAKAEDLTSDVFFRAWKGCAGIALVNGSARPWLIGVAGYVVADSYRLSYRRRALLDRLAGLREPADDGSPGADENVIEQAQSARAGRLVHSALARLSQQQREAVELVLLAEIPVAEAAQMLRVPESTICSRLENGRSRLRRLLRSSDIDRPSWLIDDRQGERQPGAADDNMPRQASDRGSTHGMGRAER